MHGEGAKGVGVYASTLTRVRRRRPGTEPQGLRFVELYTRALDDVAITQDPDFRAAVVDHVEFGTQVAMQNSNAATDEDLHPPREVPRWTWAGDDPAWTPATD